MITRASDRHVASRIGQRALTAAEQAALIGQKFNLLTITGPSRWDGRFRWWPCRCDCGTERELRDAVRHGKPKSCGCIKKLGRARHGYARVGAKTPEYNTWVGMNERCSNPAKKFYSYYGGRGITVCERWRGEHGFENFLADVGPRPSKEHSIDRIDNDRGYEPGNVRWATRVEQMRNRRSCRVLEAFGRQQTVAAWAEQYGLKLGTVCARINKGWSVERALTTPVDEATLRAHEKRRATMKQNNSGAHAA
jgi:hypothetical protein